MIENKFVSLLVYQNQNFLELAKLLWVCYKVFNGGGKTPPPPFLLLNVMFFASVDLWIKL